MIKGLKQTGRYAGIDVSKGIGIILVVMAHMVNHDTYLGMTIYSFHMPFFFLISGVFAKTYEKQKFLPFIIKNLKQLIIPFLIAFFLICGINYLVPVWRDKVTLEFIKNSLLYCNTSLQGGGTLWFLVALFWVRLLFYIFHFLILKYNYKILNVVSVGIVFFLAFYYHNITNIFGVESNYLRINSAITGLAFYMVGYLMRKEILNISDYKERPIKIFILIVTLTITTVLSQINGNVNLGGSWYGEKFLYVFFAFSGSFALIFLGDLLKKSKFLQFLGRNTMPILLIHLIIQSFVNLAFLLIFNYKIVFDINLPNMLAFFITLSASIFITYIYSKAKLMIKNKIQ